MKRLSALLALLLAAACSVGGPEDLGLDKKEQALFEQEHLQHLRTMTQNLYVGTDISEVLTADPADVPEAVAVAFQDVQLSDVPGRMEAIADEIAIVHPHLLGLQEVSLIRIQSPGDSITGGTVPAETVVYDFLAILQEALDARGLHYQAVASVQNTDVELPMAKPDGTFDDVRLTDFDVILARDDVDVSNAVGQNYATSFTLSGITVLRGWTAVDATLSPGRGRSPNETTYRFVNTHLESFVPQVRVAQAFELTQILAGETRPLVAVGDYNSEAPNGTAYQLMLGAGYDDTWSARVGRYRVGYTCCQEPDLRNEESILDQRIDFVFARNFTPHPVLAFTVGDRFFQKTDSGLWPSDHAGVVGALF